MFKNQQSVFGTFDNNPFTQNSFQPNKQEQNKPAEGFGFRSTAFDTSNAFNSHFGTSTYDQFAQKKPEQNTFGFEPQSTWTTNETPKTTFGQPFAFGDQSKPQNQDFGTGWNQNAFAKTQENTFTPKKVSWQNQQDKKFEINPQGQTGGFFTSTFQNPTPSQPETFGSTFQTAPQEKTNIFPSTPNFGYTPYSFQNPQNPPETKVHDSKLDFFSPSKVDPFPNVQKQEFNFQPTQKKQEDSQPFSFFPQTVQKQDVQLPKQESLPNFFQPISQFENKRDFSLQQPFQPSFQPPVQQQTFQQPSLQQASLQQPVQEKKENFEIPRINSNPFGTNPLLNISLTTDKDEDNYVPVNIKPIPNLKVPVKSNKDSLQEKRNCFFKMEPLNVKPVPVLKQSIKKLIIDDDTFKGMLEKENINEQKPQASPQKVEPIKEKEDLIFLPTLTKPGYYTKPNLKEMDSKHLIVKDFIIGNEFGEIKFLGMTDLSDQNLDEIISIKEKCAEVYPDNKLKAEIGSVKGFNKPAIITLKGVFPKKGKESKFEKYIERKMKKMNSKFISFNSRDGALTFEVAHF